MLSRVTQRSVIDIPRGVILCTARQSACNTSLAAQTQATRRQASRLRQVRERLSGLENVRAELHEHKTLAAWATFP